MTRTTRFTRLRTLIAWARVYFASCRLPMPVPIPVPRPGRALLALGALAASLAIHPATSAAWTRGDDASRYETTADGRLVDVQVQVDGMGVAPLYTASGHWDRQYFQAFQGRNYSLVLRNNSGRRVGVLIAVDGLNVINGRKSGLSRGEAMYVLDPYERAVIRGWRTSLDEVRRFVFVDEERSYAERSGQSNGDLGWIRVLAFREQRPFWGGLGKLKSDDRMREDAGRELESQKRQLEGDEAPAEPRASDEPKTAPSRGEIAPAPSTHNMMGYRDGGSQPESNPGTGWGQRSSDHVNQTWFVAEGAPVDQITLRYEYASGLRALGIAPVRNVRDRLWERERGQMGFAQPPRW